MRFKVITADKEVRYLYRKWHSYWFSDTSSMMTFYDQEGRKVKLAKHWIIELTEDKK